MNQRLLTIHSYLSYFYNLVINPSNPYVMKKVLYLVLFCHSISNITASEVDSVKRLDNFSNIYRYQNYFISGQPSLEALEFLNSKGVSTIINLRSVDENDKFKGSGYNEQRRVNDLGMVYFSLPVSTNKDYTPENLARFDSVISASDGVLIHCAGAGRARYFFIAYLIKYKGYNEEKAFSIGQQMGYSDRIKLLLEEY